jgi:hypothetical protein
MLTFSIADRREFIKISQAVGVGFLVMGAVGYLVKLSESLIGFGVSVCISCSSTLSLAPAPLFTMSFLMLSRANDFLPVHIPVNNILVGGA